MKERSVRKMITHDLGVATMVGLRLVAFPLYLAGNENARNHLDTATREAGAMTTTVADAILNTIDSIGTRRNPNVKVE